MKLKNIVNDVRQFTEFGQVVSVRPGEVVEVGSKINYDPRVFKIVDTLKSKEPKEKRTVTKEVR